MWVTPSVEPDSIPAAMGEAARFQATTSAEGFLRGALSDQHRVDAILHLVERLDHVGFMATQTVEADLASAAAAAGFGDSQRTFASTILARQLGTLAGRETVPTRIFKARGELLRGVPIGIEVAIPDELERDVVREWIARGIGAHVALRVIDGSALDQLEELVEADGYRMPEFMRGKPATNPEEGLAAVFFDRRPTDPIGLEFCHYE